MSNTRMKPLHPGEILFKELMEPLGISQNKLGQNLGVHPRTINEIVNGKRGISAQMALRLARCFKTSADLWIGLQKDYELEVSRDQFSAKINKEVKVFQTKKSSQIREGIASKVAI